MKIKKNRFNMIVLFISITTFFVLLSGFVLAVRDILNPVTSPTIVQTAVTNPVPKKQLLVGLGDSLTRGVGDKKGVGYFGMIRDDLKKDHPSLQATNLAISGQNSTQLRQQLEKPQVKNLLKQARWITLTVGGNDLNRSSGGFEQINIAKAKESKEKYLANLQVIFQKIHALNPQASLFMFGLYNPYGDLSQSDVTDQVVREWNETIRQVTAKHSFIVLVPTFDLFQLDPKRYLYTDHFHPNNLGYRRMATRLLQVITDSK